MEKRATINKFLEKWYLKSLKVWKKQGLNMKKAYNLMGLKDGKNEKGNCNRFDATPDDECDGGGQWQMRK